MGRVIITRQIKSESGWNNARRGSRNPTEKASQLDARKSNLKLLGLPEKEGQLPLKEALADFLKDIKAFRKPLTFQKYEYILELFCEHVAPKSDARETVPEDIYLSYARLVI